MMDYYIISYLIVSLGPKWPKSQKMAVFKAKVIKNRL